MTFCTMLPHKLNMTYIKWCTYASNIQVLLVCCKANCESNVFGSEKIMSLTSQSRKIFSGRWIRNQINLLRRLYLQHHTVPIIPTRRSTLCFQELVHPLSCIQVPFISFNPQTTLHKNLIQCIIVCPLGRNKMTQQQATVFRSNRMIRMTHIRHYRPISKP